MERGDKRFFLSKMRNSSGEASGDGNRALGETLLFALSSALGFVFSLARTKLQALAWGPVGLGAAGLMQASMSTASLVCGLGVDGVVTRELAEAGADEKRARPVAVAALWGMTVLAIAGGVASFVVFATMDRLGFPSPAEALVVAGAVTLSVVGANLRAIVAGTRQARLLARSMMISSFAATALVAVVVAFSNRPLMWAFAVAAVPLAQFVTLVPAARRSVPFSLASWTRAVPDAIALSRRASLLAVAGVLPVLSQLLVRATARGSLSDQAFGSFQATMALAATSTSVLASSVGPSVLPRLSAVSADKSKLVGVLNDSVGTYLLLFAPIVLTMQSIPELVVRLLYSREFVGVVDQLPWQMAGEVLRLPSWVMAAALTAQGRYRAYFVVEAIPLVVMVLGVRLASQSGSLGFVGLAISLANCSQFLVLLLLLQKDEVRMSRPVLLRVAGLVALVLAGAWLIPQGHGVRAPIVLAALVAAVLALRRIRSVRSASAR